MAVEGSRTMNNLSDMQILLAKITYMVRSERLMINESSKGNLIEITIKASIKNM